MTKSLSGIFPALLTPFHANGEINFHALSQLIELNIAKGVSGFYVCGSTAECFLLTDEQRMAIVEQVLAMVNNRVTVIVHVGCIDQVRSVRLAEHAAKHKADVVSSIPPFYYGFDFNSIKAFYFALADATDLPVLIYNFPANSGVTLTVDNVRAFLDDGRFLGVKHTSSDMYMLSHLKLHYPQSYVYNGYDEMFLSGLAAGADGGIGSTYNFMAEKFISMMKHFKDGRVKDALAIQHEVNCVISALNQYGVLPAEKAALELMGIPMGECRKPFPSLNMKQREHLQTILQENHCTVMR